MNIQLFNIRILRALILVLILQGKLNAQENTPISGNALNRIGELVRDENGNVLYQIEESVKYGYVYTLRLQKNSILTDPVTGLQWREKPRASIDKPSQSWYETQKWLDEIQDGWRLPTIEELMELFNNHFRGYAIVWTSKEDEKDNEKAYIFDMQAGISKDFTGAYIYSKARKNLDIGEMMGCEPLVVREAIQNRAREYALKVTPLTSDIKPDGKTKVQISAQLYSYIPNDNSSSKPVAGKPLSIEINDLDRIKPGTLSATSAVTDYNGIVTFTYTAPTAETLEQMDPLNRLGTTIKISNEEFGMEELAYISFVTDKGKIWVEPGMSPLSDTGFVPPDKRYPALISANFYEGNLEPIANSEVTFSIKENNPVGMLRSADGREGKQLTLKTDASGAAYVQYYYASSSPPDKRITETIEAKTTNMSAPFKAYVSTGFNLVIDDAKSGYESSKEINAGEIIPLHITVRDEWNPQLDLGYMMNYWGDGNVSGKSKLYVKLEIEKQGFVPNYVSDLLEMKFYPEPLYTETLSIRPLSLSREKNLLFIPEWSLKNYGYPQVKPLFTGMNNYEIRVTMVDENGKPVFETKHPRRTAFVSIPTGLPASTFRIYFLSNPLGPHTEISRYGRLVLSTVTFGKIGGLGALLSLADAATAINTGNAEELANVMISAVKDKALGDAADNVGNTAKRFKAYNNISMAEQYVSFGLTSYSDNGLVAQMESKVLGGIAQAGFGSNTKMVVLKGNGSQKLFIEGDPADKSQQSKTSNSNFKISISGFDKKTMETIDKIGKSIKSKKIEIPVQEGKYVPDDKLQTISLKNGNVSIYTVPSDMNVVSENAFDMKIY